MTAETRAREDQPAAVRKAVLRYYGSKGRLAKTIIALLPPHTTYCEPFGGSAAVLLRKRPSAFEVYNDRDGQLVTFFRVLRTRPAALIRAIELTPHSRFEHDCALRRLRDDSAVTDELETARLFYVASWQSRHWPTAKWRSGWRYERAATRGKSLNAEWNETDHLWAAAARLKRVQIDCDDAFKVMRRFDTADTVHYVDPPYVWATRHRRWFGNSYRHELSDDAHRELAEALHSLRGSVLLSAYPSPLYDALYGPAGWHKLEVKALADVGGAPNARRTEVLWLNPHAQALQRQQPLALLEYADDGGFL